MILTKGGIWTNMEDEILKVAVIKYGENQWRRISFLLSSSFFQKSAMQCRARWYEWVHPSINKMEWTRQEDEKLLHAVKIAPGQWRTIAGRTASECIDPVSMPASSDPVDMEAFEVHTLSKARAPLCNTRGNKGIRKAREKQLEDANKKRKVKGTIDYNAEVLLFEKKPPSGFFHVTEECSTVMEPKFTTTIEELESEKRFDKEARLRKEGAERNKTQGQDVPSAILQANKLNDQETVKKRPKIDHQLKHIAKLRFGPDRLYVSLALLILFVLCCVGTLKLISFVHGWMLSHHNH